jgi:hypothetical protein
MGIDKANVKTVIHIQLPENMEIIIKRRGVQDEMVNEHLQCWQVL